MPAVQFEFMRDICAAPSPVGLEAAMTEGVLQKRFDEIALPSWKVHTDYTRAVLAVCVVICFQA
jgi:endoglucanase